MKNVLVVNIGDEFGGAEKSVSDVMEGINEDPQFNVKFIAQHPKMKELMRKKNIKYTDLAIFHINKTFIGVAKLFYGCLKILIEIVRFQPDIVISNTDLSHILITIPCLMMKCKFIWILRDYHLNKTLKNIFEDKAKSIICVSEHLRQFYGNKENYIVIPNGIRKDIDNNHCLDEKICSLKKKEEVLFGIACRFVKWKGLENLIQSFYHIKKNNKEFKGKLLIAGDAPKHTPQYEYMISLKEKVKELQLEENIIFVGWIENVLGFYHNCDVVLSSSITKYGGPESFGRAIIEAWSVEKPIISTSCGAPGYIIENNKTGILVQEDDIISMANAVKLLYSDKQLRRQMGMNGYSELVDNYDIKNIVNRYKDIL